MTDIDEAVAEIERVAAAGFRAILLPAIPPKPYYSREFDPVWAAAQANGVHVFIHSQTGGVKVDDPASTTLKVVMGQASEVNKPITEKSASQRMVTQCVYGPMIPSRVIIELIGGGVPERYPDLHFALIEFNAHWLASLVGSMDKCWVDRDRPRRRLVARLLGQRSPRRRPAADGADVPPEREVALPAEAERVRRASVPRLVPGRSGGGGLAAHHRALDHRVGRRLPPRRRHVPREQGADRQPVRRRTRPPSGNRSSVGPWPDCSGSRPRWPPEPACGFEGRVAVVTGAGRGLGRAYALLLAARGARVVVNDLGGSMDGKGADAGVADAVSGEIVAAGGAAIADHSDVATATGAQALIEAAVEHFGRLDVLVNNAGIIRWAGPPEADEENLAQHLAVHVVGSFSPPAPRGPTWSSRSYGRIVMTTSSGMFGLPKNVSYATAKAAVIGLTRSLTTARRPDGHQGQSHRARRLHPDGRAGPADGGSSGAGSEPPQMSPELVAPMVAFLAHESCPVSGEIYAAGAGRFARIFIASTEGYVQTTRDPTVEDVAEHWAEINDETGYYVPADLSGWSAAFMAHLLPSAAGPAGS